MLQLNSPLKRSVMQSLSTAYNDRNAAGKNYILLFRSGVMPTTSAAIDAAFVAQGDYHFCNYSNGATNHICAFIGSTTNSAPSFILGNFVSLNGATGLPGISGYFQNGGMTSNIVNGIITHCMIIPYDAGLQNGRPDQNINTASSGYAGYNSITAGYANVFKLTQQNASGSTTNSKAIWFCASVGVTGTNHPVTVANTTVSGLIAPTITSVNFSLI